MVEHKKAIVKGILSKFSDKNLFLLFILAIFFFGMSMGIYFDLAESLYLVFLVLSMIFLGMMIFFVFFAEIESESEEEEDE